MLKFAIPNGDEAPLHPLFAANTFVVKTTTHHIFKLLNIHIRNYKTTLKLQLNYIKTTVKLL